MNISYRVDKLSRLPMLFSLLDYLTSTVSPKQCLTMHAGGDSRWIPLSRDMKQCCAITMKRQHWIGSTIRWREIWQKYDCSLKHIGDGNTVLDSKWFTILMRAKSIRLVMIYLSERHQICVAHYSVLESESQQLSTLNAPQDYM